MCYLNSIVETMHDYIMNSPFKLRLRTLMQMSVSSQFFSFPHTVPIRRFLYRLFFDIGEDVKVGSNVKLQCRHRNKYNKDRDIHIGKHVLIGADSRIDYSGGVFIKDYAKISSDVVILTHSHMVDKAAYIKPLQPSRFSPLFIEEKAWIGERATILPSTSRIGKCAIVGSGAVVGKDVPDYAIVSGNPARVIGYARH